MVMAMFYGLNSDSSASFFNSMLGNQSSNSMYNTIASSIGDYAAIKNGSYRTLVKAYYAKQAGETEEVKGANKTENKKDSTATVGTNAGVSASVEKKTMVELSTKADSLMTSADALMQKGSDSLFRKKEVTNPDGTTGYEYDTDKIYKAVKDFVDDYNAMISQVAKSDNASVLDKGLDMIEDMATYEKFLQELGITIQEDDTLAVDEDAFKKADMLDAKSMLQGSVSVVGKTYQNAAELERVASSAAKSDSTYTSNATYASALTGALYNNYL